FLTGSSVIASPPAASDGTVVDNDRGSSCENGTKWNQEDEGGADHPRASVQEDDRKDVLQDNVEERSADQPKCTDAELARHTRRFPALHPGLAIRFGRVGVWLVDALLGTVLTLALTLIIAT